MKQTRKKYDAKFKAKVAIETRNERKALNQLAAKYEVSPVMISRWKKEFINNSAAAFETPRLDDERLPKEKMHIFARLETWRCTRILPSGYPQTLDFPRR